MLHLKEFQEIGFIRKAHGNDGAAKIAVEEVFLDDLKEQDFVFIQVDGLKVPFRIQKVYDAHDLILKLSRISSPDQLLPYHLSKLFLIRNELVHARATIDDENFYQSLEQFELYDDTNGYVGEIIKIEDFPQQKMAIVRVKNQDVLIPLHKDLISNVNKENGELWMNLPEGLI